MISPAAARRPGAFYGWWMVLFCTIVRGFTAPGQTMGVSAFTDDLVASLDISRSAFSTVYLIGTLTGAVVLPFVGRWVDYAGVKRSMTVIGVLFACAIALTGTVQNMAMLAVAFVGLRMFGQGSLHLIGTTGVVIWFEQRRGLALAISGMGSVALFSLAPLAFSFLIDAVGWRWSWPIIGAAVAITVVPIALFAIVDRPDRIGQVADGHLTDRTVTNVRMRSSTVGEAIRTPAFWTLAGLTMLMAAVITGLTLHNTDLLGAQGLSKSQAGAIFIPQALGSMSSSMAFGWMTDRFPARPLMFLGGICMAVGTFLATVASPGLMAMAYGFATGLAMGSIFAVSGALYPKWFGVDHIGSINGLTTSMTVAASAVGPLILSVGNEAADSYTPVVIGCAIVCAAMAAVALVVPTPSPPSPTAI